MKRLTTILLLMCLLAVSASADGALSKSMDAALTVAQERTAEAWLADEESRALLTVCLWRDYSAMPDVQPCPQEGLAAGSLVASHEAGYLMVIIPAEKGRLTIYYLPGSGNANYLWQGGDYDTVYKKEALEKQGITVWENPSNAILQALEK